MRVDIKGEGLQGENTRGNGDVFKLRCLEEEAGLGADRGPET